MAKNKKVTRAPRGLTGRTVGNPENWKGFVTMTSEIIHLAARFQRWVNQAVARRLEAEAAKFAR